MWSMVRIFVKKPRVSSHKDWKLKMEGPKNQIPNPETCYLGARTSNYFSLRNTHFLAALTTKGLWPWLLLAGLPLLCFLTLLC